MKKLIYSITVLVVALGMCMSCSDDTTRYSITTPGEGDFKLAVSDTLITLTEANGSAHTAVTFSWDSLTYKLTTPVIYTLQIDTLNGTFANPVETEAGTNVYTQAFNDSVFNKKLLNQLKLTAGTTNTIKVRLKAALQFGNNAVYSDVHRLKVTTYATAKVVDLLYMPGVNGGDWSDFSTKLCSRKSDGIYEGFVNAVQWANFKFTNQTDFKGAVYGSSKNSLSTLTLETVGNQQNNIWFDEGGYFLVKVDLNTMTWTKTAITSMCVTGDFNGWSLTANPLTYDSTHKVWKADCNISSIGWGIQLIVNGDWSFKYGDTDGDGSLVLGGSNIVPSSTGNKTITVDLSNPQKYSYTIQ